MQDKDVLKHIKDLVDEEQKLYSKSNLSDEERNELKSLQIELDQYWDLMRQRKALKEMGDNPDEARLRGPNTVENYEQ